MERDRKRRLQAIGEARIAIEDCLANPSSEPVVEQRKHAKLPWVVAAALGLLLIVSLGAWWRSTQPAPKPLIRLNVDMGTDSLTNGVAGLYAVISRDGTKVVYPTRGSDGKLRLSIRLLDQPQGTPLAGTEGGAIPFFSPNGQWIGFFADGRLKKILAQGGGGVTLCDAPNPRGASWGEDGNIIAALGSTSGLSLVSADSGNVQPLTQLNKGEVTHRFPQHLPGGKAFLFVSSSSIGNYVGATIEAQSLKTGERKTLERDAYFGHYLASGHLIFMRQGVLFAAPFNLDRLEPAGAAVPILEDVPDGAITGTTPLNFSDTGTIIYRTGGGMFRTSIFWLDASGKTEPLRPIPGAYASPRLSPDGKRLAVVALTSGKRDIWIYDPERDSMTRLTSAPGDNISPVWTPDGKRIAFASEKDGIFWIRADGGGEAQRLTQSATPQVPSSFSPDGKWLALMNQRPNSEIWTLSIDWSDPGNPKPGKPEPFQGALKGMQPAFSPDGRWLAYGFSEAGRFTPAGAGMQVYVRPFPGPGGKWQISSGEALAPVWSPTTQELFYRTMDRQIMVVSYTIKGDTFVPGKPRLWSERQVWETGFGASYDVAPDGKRLAALMDSDEGKPSPPTHLVFLLNYFDELRRRVPLESK
jgi:serine/threonine-protein kinase